MKPRLLFAACLLTATPLAPAVPAPGSSVQPHHTAAAPASVSAAVVTRMHQVRVPGVALAKIEHGRLAWTAVYGERAPGTPMTRDTVFNVASLTKPVFALMTLQLVADGRIGLDTPLAEDWVDPDLAADPRVRMLTPRLVLSHQSGLPNWRGSGKLAFLFTPGTRHEYSGEGYEYLRRALERRTGKSMPELMQQTVLDSVRMPHTSFGWSERARGHLATGYQESGQPYAGSDPTERGPNGAANMLTTIGDYGRFAAWVARGADLPDALFAQMTRPQSQREHPAEFFGLGWRIVRHGHHVVLSHDGRERGVRTQVFVDPSTGEGLVILTSSDNGELLTRPLVDAVLPQGDALMAAVDRDVWTYLQRMPPGTLPVVARAAVGSPAFMSRLLHAVDVALVQPSSLDAAAKRRAHEAIDPLVRAMLDQQVDPSQAKELIERLVQTGTGGPRWRDRFSREQAQAWLAALAERRAHTEVSVPAARLDRYAGDYLLPSKNLMIHIGRTPSGLQASAPGIPVVTLRAESQTLFSFKEDSTRFAFVEGADGRVSGMRVIWGPSRSELARRIRGANKADGEKAIAEGAE